MENYLDITLLLLILIAAIMIIRSTNLLSLIISSSIFSIFCSLSYLIMKAPDVALTEAAVGACASTCIMLAALRFIPEEITKESGQTLTIIIFLGFFAFLSYSVLGIHSYGDVGAITNKGAAEYYKQNAGQDIGLLSIVNSILASYRGFDTFGETLVIFTAGLCVILVLGRKNKT